MHLQSHASAMLRCRAFYPLDSAGAASWPLPEYTGSGIEGVGVVPDALFGSAVLCIKASQVPAGQPDTRTGWYTEHRQIIPRSARGLTPSHDF